MPLRSHKATLKHLFRTKYGEVLAAVLRRFGYQHFELAEEAVQTAFQRALEKWSKNNMPENPGGWLYIVARNAYLESVRRLRTEQVKLEQLQTDFVVDEQSPLIQEYTESATALDDLATMILLCCNPELSPKAQVCLTLKSACGFSVKEIARALGMQEEATKKTITRAKQTIAEDRQVLHTLNPQRITPRFSHVLETIYAMFNEGYAASNGKTQLRRDIAEEAIHLADIFLHTTWMPESHRGELMALTALMLFQFARFDARTTAVGLPIRLQDQDRTKWNQELIKTGLDALAASQSSDHLTALHLEARIAAEHATSPSFQSTKWPKILSFYNQLLDYKDTPEVRLSRIVALHHAQGWQAALEELDQLAANTWVRSFLLHAVRADLLESAGKPNAAAKEWQKAQTNAPTTADRSFIEQKLKNLT